MPATDQPLLDVVLTMLSVVVFVAWTGSLVVAVVDLVRSRGRSRAAKAAWVAVMLLLPAIGVVLYVATRHRRVARQRGRVVHAGAASSRGPAEGVVAEKPNRADELAKLAAMHHTGLIGNAEYERRRADVLASAGIK